MTRREEGRGIRGQTVVKRCRIGWKRRVRGLGDTIGRYGICGGIERN